MVGRNRREDVSKPDRGVSPIVGLVLLFGIVFLGAALVFVSGSAVLDAFESEADREKAQLCMDEADHRLSTVAATGKSQPMSFDETGCRSEVAETGEITVAWYNTSESDPLNGSTSASPWTDSQAVSEPLGSFEFELDDRTLAHQGGGVWERSDSGVSIDRAPNMGFEDGTFQLNLMRIDRADVDGSDPAAERNHEVAAQTTENLSEAVTNPNGDSFAVKIESEYAEGWYRHLERETEDRENATVELRDDENVVVLTVEEMVDRESTQFTIEADGGLTPQGGGPDGNLIEPNDKFHINATVTNDGPPKKANITLSIWDGSDEVATRTIESKDKLGRGESLLTKDKNAWDWEEDSRNHFFNTNPNPSDPKSIDLEPGTKYEYDIEVNPNGDSLEERGTFLYLHDGTHYTVDETSVDSTGEEIALSATIQNTGDEAGNESVALEVSGESSTENTTATTDVELDTAAKKTVTWTIDETAWPNGDYDFTITTDDDEQDGTFTVAAGGVFEISEDLGIPADEQAGERDGQVVTDADDVTIGANITNTYTDEQTQNVTLDVLDESGNTVAETATNLTIGGGDTKRVELTVDPLDPGSIYEYNVSTENDDLDELGSFLVVDEPSEFTIETIDVDNPVKPTDSMTIDVEIKNRDGADEQYVWIEGFDGSIVAIDQVELDRDEEQPVEFEWSNVVVPESSDDTAITVRTERHSATADVDIDPLLQVNDVRVVDGPVEPGESVTIEADIKNVGGETDQEIVLEGLDGSDVDSKTVTVSDGEIETVTFEYETGEQAATDRVVVRTDDDEMDEVVVVERDGPVCSEVTYDGSGTSADPYKIRSIDELQCINDHDLDAHYELVDDIDAQGTEYWNGSAGFEPIGPEGHNYPNTYWITAEDIDHEPFNGVFDGNGYVIDGLTIDRPDQNFVGLFGATGYTQDFHPETGDDVAPGEGSVIENIRLTNVSVVGNQHVGGLAGQAGGTVLNARSEGYVEGQEQLVGGLIGDGAHANIDNRLVAVGTVKGGEITPESDANRLNHEGIGGLVGRATWNTRVSVAYTQTDVSGDEHVGAVIGTSSYRDSVFEQLYTNGAATADSANAGAIVGTVLSEGDEFDESIYWDESIESSAYGEAGNWYRNIDMDNVQTDWNGRETSEMTGLDVNQNGRMGNLDFDDEDGGPWVAIRDDYPRFAWELAAEGAFEVAIDDVENVTAGEAAEVNVTVTSRHEDRDETTVTQTISLTNPDGQTVDTRSVTLPSTIGVDEETEIMLTWQTDGTYIGTGDVTVRSEDMEDSAPIEIDPAEHGPGGSDGPGLGPLPGSSDTDDGEFDFGPGETSDTSEPDPDIDIQVDAVEVS